MKFWYFTQCGELIQDKKSYHDLFLWRCSIFHLLMNYFYFCEIKTSMNIEIKNVNAEIKTSVNIVLISVST